MAPPPLHLPPYLAQMTIWPTARARSSAPPFQFQRPPSPLHPRSSCSLLTEALGAESLVGPDDATAAMDGVDGRAAPPCKAHGCSADDGAEDERAFVTLRPTTTSGRAFPPPISVIGKSGRPWLSLRAHREDGRLVLREMRLPSQELLQQCREDGRFKLLIRHPEAGGGRCFAAGAGARGSGIGKGAPEDLTAD